MSSLQSRRNIVGQIDMNSEMPLDGSQSLLPGISAKTPREQASSTGLARTSAMLATLLACFAAICSLIPVWLPSSLPPTCDGPSHVYNAMIARAVALGQEPFAATYSLRSFPRCNVATDLALGVIGARFGWVNGERIWITLVLLGQFFAFWYVFRALPTAWRIVLSAFLANNWFFWMGFYDFSLSLAVFVWWMKVLLAKPRPVNYLQLLLFSVLLYSTHFFTLVIAVGAAVWIFAWRIFHRQMTWPPVSVLILPALLIVREVFGPVSHGGMGWWGWSKVLKSVVGLVGGDALVTFTWLDLVASAAFMALVWAGVYWYLFQRKPGTQAQQAWVPVFGLLLFAVSIIAPPQVGVGTHVAARLRALGDLVLIMSTAEFAISLPFLQTLRSPGMSAVLSAVLLVQAGRTLAAGQAVYTEASRVSSVIAAAGVQPGAWICSRLGNTNLVVGRIVPYKHLADRAFCSANVRSLDNYEAAIGNFQVQWRMQPNGYALWHGEPNWWVPMFPEMAGQPMDDLWIITDRSSAPALNAQSLVTETHRTAYGLTATEVKRAF